MVSRRVRILAGPGQSLQLLAFRDTLDSWFESRLDVPIVNWFRCLSLSLAFRQRAMFLSFYVLSLPVYHHSTLLPSSQYYRHYYQLIRWLLCPRPWIQAVYLPGIVSFLKLGILHCPKIISREPCSAIASVATENSFLPGWVLSPRLCPSPSACFSEVCLAFTTSARPELVGTTSLKCTPTWRSIEELQWFDVCFVELLLFQNLQSLWLWPCNIQLVFLLSVCFFSFGPYKATPDRWWRFNCTPKKSSSIWCTVMTMITRQTGSEKT